MSSDLICQPANPDRGGDPFPLRVSSSKLATWRGSVIHAAVPCVSHGHHVYTACHRLIVAAYEHTEHVPVTCAHCKTVLAKGGA